MIVTVEFVVDYVVDAGSGDPLSRLEFLRLVLHATLAFDSVEPTITASPSGITTTFAA